MMVFSVQRSPRFARDDALSIKDHHAGLQPPRDGNIPVQIRLQYIAPVYELI
jgi:hypothetical protein